MTGSLSNFTESQTVQSPGGGHWAPLDCVRHSFDSKVFNFCHWKGGKEEEVLWAEGKGAIFIRWGCPHKVPQNEGEGEFEQQKFSASQLQRPEV